MFTDANTVEIAAVHTKMLVPGMLVSLLSHLRTIHDEHVADLPMLVKLSLASIFQSKLLSPTLNTLAAIV